MDKKILLTIDDGPSEKAGELIDYLSGRQIGAILFCRGDFLRERSDWTVRAIQQGYIIGNHSYSHPNFSSLNKHEVEEQVGKTDSIIDMAYAQASQERRAKYFRFPYGRIKGSGATDAAKKGNQEILAGFGYWSPIDSQRDWHYDVDVRDWNDAVHRYGKDASLIHAKEKLAGLQEGNILDLHDNEPTLSLGLFQSICQYVLARDFTFYCNDSLGQQASKRTPEILRRSRHHCAGEEEKCQDPI